MENLTGEHAAERLLEDLRAAGLEVTGDGEGDLRVEGDETAFTRYRETIRSNKAALLEHLARRADGVAQDGPAATASRIPSFCAGIACPWHGARGNMCRWRSRDGRNWVNTPATGLRDCPARPSPRQNPTP